MILTPIDLFIQPLTALSDAYLIRDKIESKRPNLSRGVLEQVWASI